MPQTLDDPAGALYDGPPSDAEDGNDAPEPCPDPVDMLAELADYGQFVDDTIDAEYDLDDGNNFIDLFEEQANNPSTDLGGGWGEVDLPPSESDAVLLNPFTADVTSTFGALRRPPSTLSRKSWWPCPMAI